MDPRPYQPTDLPACKAILPTLEAPTHFHVFEHNGEILAFGGYEITSPTSAQIKQYMVHPDWRCQGIGRYLILYLLKQISAEGNIAEVRAIASSDLDGFFEKQGFRPLPSSSTSGRIYTKKLTVCT
ncbi:MAG: GNAT family N-acetyltransferase [Acidobacteria bacterium]|nr:GNAT family N-acetyltransferase [Acidobacteriota bacterium]